MSGDWAQYFDSKTETIDGKCIKCYAYKDKNVITLPSNLPMPPTDAFYYMFYHCDHLQDITVLANWDVSNVKYMNGMFDGCWRLQNITALAKWNVSNVKDMSNMFRNCIQLQDITALANWDVSNVKDMRGIFNDCHQLQDITALANWNVSNVEDMCYMFSYCIQLQDITALANWDVSNVKDMTWMSSYCNQLNISNDSDVIKSLLRNSPKRSYPKQDHTQLLQSLWERVKPLLKDTTPLNGYFKRYTISESINAPIQTAISIDLPPDWQNIDLPQWNP